MGAVDAVSFTEHEVGTIGEEIWVPELELGHGNIEFAFNERAVVTRLNHVVSMRV